LYTYDVGVLEGRTGDQASDTAKAVDTEVDRLVVYVELVTGECRRLQPYANAKEVPRLTRS